MALNFTELGTELQAELGKTGDTSLITTTRVGRWINQSLIDIIYQWPGLRDVNVLDKHTWQCQSDTYEYDVKDFIDKPIAHIIKIRYVDTTNSNYRQIEPFTGGLDQWDAQYPYIPNLSTGIPTCYCRRGNTVELAPMPGSDQDLVPIWIEYTYLPRALSGTDTPVLTNFDECLIQWGKSYAMRLLGKTNEDTAMLMAANEQKQYAMQLVGDRVKGERDWDYMDQIPYNGP